MFDGHGGHEVAHFSKKYFGDGLLAEPAYKNGDYKAALTRGFLGIDERLNKGGIKELAQMRQEKPPQKSKMMEIFEEVV